MASPGTPEPERAPAEPEAPRPTRADGPGLHAGLETAARLWLLRHPEVDDSFREVAYGDLDVPLSAAGREDAEALARAFAPLALVEVVSSPLARSRMPAERIAAAGGVPLRVEAGLAEIHRGNWQGRRVADLDPAEVEAFYRDPWSFDAHGGERDADVLARAWPVVEGAVRRAADGEVLLVAHYNVIRIVASHALGIAPSASFSLRVDPGRAVVLFDARALPERRVMVPGWILEHSNLRPPGPRRA